MLPLASREKELCSPRFMSHGIPDNLEGCVGAGKQQQEERRTVYKSQTLEVRIPGLGRVHCVAGTRELPS